MSEQLQKRDELDEQMSRALRRIRLGRPLPQPAQDDPSDDQLLQLLDGQLEGRAKDEVESLVNNSPFSADRLDVLREALAEFEAEAAPAPAPALSAVKTSRTRLSPDESPDKPGRFARLVFAVRKSASDAANQVIDFMRGTDAPMSMGLAAVATRGAAAAMRSEAPEQHYYKFTRRFGDWDATIQIENVVDRGIELRVELERDGVALKDARASLRRRGKLLESVRIRDGVAGFKDLAADHYSLTITRHDSEIGQLTLDFLS